jgi:broad specificity phosphatase PhoE
VAGALQVYTGVPGLGLRNLDVLISSAEPKATETAELVAKRLRIGWRIAEDLDEHRRPFVEAPDFETYIKHFFAQPAERVFGEESANEARERFAAAVDAVLAAEAGRNAGIIAHGTVIAVYAAPMFGIGAAALWQRMQHPSFVVDTDVRAGLRIVEGIE